MAGGMTVQIIRKFKPMMFDVSDWALVSEHRWHVNTYGYAASSVYNDGKLTGVIYMHRLILGVNDPKIIVDHKNRIRTDNRKENLRLTDPSGNARNTSSSGKCKYLGVTQRTPGPYQKEPRYVARIRASGKNKYLGTFKSEEEAALAYNRAAIQYFGEFASLNKV